MVLMIAQSYQKSWGSWYRTDQNFLTNNLIGFILDSVLLELSLRDDKALEPWYNRKPGTKRELLSLIGLLQHCCQAITLGHPFLRRLIDRATTVRELHHFVCLSCWEKDDIVWWYQLLTSWNGKSLFHFPDWNLLQDFAVTSDSSGNVGFGAILGKPGFAQVWPRHTTEIDIAIKEFIPMCIAAVIWGHRWSRKCIKFKSDNSAVVVCLQYGSCRNRHMAFLLRELAICAVLSNFTHTRKI